MTLFLVLLRSLALKQNDASLPVVDMSKDSKLSAHYLGQSAKKTIKAEVPVF